MNTSIAAIDDGPPANMPRTDNPVAVYLAGLSAGSRRTMLGALDTMAGLAAGGRADARSFPWHELRHQHTAAIRSRLAEQYSAATANKMLAALRGVLKAAWRLGLMDGETYHRAVAVTSVKGCVLPKGRSLTAGELRAMFEPCARDSSAAGRRDAALLAVLYGAGLRRAEVVALDLADYDRETGALTIRAGKGNKERIAYVTGGAWQALDDWVVTRGGCDGPLFVPVRKGGLLRLGRRLADQSVYGALRKRAKQAGLDRFSPHDLRRTFVSDLLDAGADIAMVQRLAGHSQPSTTARYDRRPEQAKRKAAELLHVPFRRPTQR